jgi:hypothetical protein
VDIAHQIPEKAFANRAVHAEAARQHQNEDDKKGRCNLVALFGKHGSDDIERVILGVQPKQVEDPHHAQHPKHHEPAQEEEGQNGKQVDHAVIRVQKTDARSRPAILRIKVLRCPYTERIFDTKDHYGRRFQRLNHTAIVRKLVKGLQKHADNVGENDRHDKEVKCQARNIVLFADLYDIKYASPHSLSFPSEIISAHGRKHRRPQGSQPLFWKQG